MATSAELSQEWQIALEAPNGYKLYSQELIGDGYDSDHPFDFYVVDSSLELLDQDVIDGTNFRGEYEIDWQGLIEYAAREYSPECESFAVFADEFDECNVLDPDDLSEELMDAGIM